jgi:hypothetical protein
MLLLCDVNWKWVLMLLLCDVNWKWVLGFWRGSVFELAVSNG